MTQEELDAVLADHKLWLEEKGGSSPRQDEQCRPQWRQP